MSDDFQKLVNELTRKGYLVSSLIQRSKNSWLAWIRKEGEFSCGNGKGTTPLKALRKARDTCVVGDAWSRHEHSKRKRVVTKRKRVRAEG